MSIEKNENAQNTSVPKEGRKCWEKPVLVAVSLEAKEDILGACSSPSHNDVDPLCGPDTQCLV